MTPAWVLRRWRDARGPGTVGDRRDALRIAGDAVADAILAARRPRQPTAPSRRVLVLGVERPGMHMQALGGELRRSSHEVTIHTCRPGGRGKFENINALLGDHPATGHDWVLVVDDDVMLPPGFLNGFLGCAEATRLRLAQPAHRLRSHTAWQVTRRRPGSLVRRTCFVEIGPVTALHAETFPVLLPFPEGGMGWGLDQHWGAVAREQDWRIGIVDATPIRHLAAPARSYSATAARAQAEMFLRDRPHVTRQQAAWSQRIL